jgi:DNA-binding transcriptional MerR regulator/methylmalonyl-CoA mutase cobalamin-binding subunit
MNGAFGSNPPVVSIAAAERDTGLSKETLRIWERRYGFPQPERDAAGERAYPRDQVEKLRVVKRLMDAGHRPGRVVALPTHELQQLLDGTAPVRAAAHAPVADLGAFIELLRQHDVHALRQWLAASCLRLGLARFVLEVVVPLNTRVGDAWMRGELEVFEEHVYTECVQGVLRSTLHPLSANGGASPAVLLATFPGEPHGLGLLMAEALCALEGGRCISLGVQTPVWDIARAAVAYGAHIVALSFTGCTPPNQTLEGLAELRHKLPAAVEVWAGGAVPTLRRRPVPGVLAMASLDLVAGELQRWRASLA